MCIALWLCKLFDQNKNNDYIGLVVFPAEDASDVEKDAYMAQLELYAVVGRHPYIVRLFGLVAPPPEGKES